MLDFLTWIKEKPKGSVLHIIDFRQLVLNAFCYFIILKDIAQSNYCHCCH